MKKKAMHLHGHPYKWTSNPKGLCGKTAPYLVTLNLWEVTCIRCLIKRRAKLRAYARELQVLQFRLGKLSAL